MFRVKETLQEDVTFNLETDFYVPIKIEFPSNDISTAEIYYYRIINDHSSFLEIKVNSKSHKIYCVTIVSINDLVDYSELKLNFDDLPIRRGNPIIDTELWGNKRIVDTNNNFSIAFNVDKIYLLLSNVGHVAQRLILPNIEFLLDENDYIVGYIFCDIPFDKRRDLEEGIAASVSQRNDLN